MFLVGGIMISRPGVRIGWGIEAGIEPKSLALAQYAAWPLMAALIVALLFAFIMLGSSEVALTLLMWSRVFHYNFYLKRS